MKHNFKFEFSPNLITLLGEQLIHDKKIAVSELVKNAYDADADWVEVNVGENFISIYDNGCGMDIDTIQNVWLKPGVSSKDNIKTGRLTPKHHRMPIGEKGVGRLGSHKLGQAIELFTKTKQSNEIHLRINWHDIEKADSLSNLQAIVVTENSQPVVFKDKQTGTKILISELKETWLDLDYQNLSRDLTNLISPFAGKDEKFQIRFKKNTELFTNDLLDEVRLIKENALFEFHVLIANGLIKDFRYKFKTWQGLEKVRPRTITLAEDKDFIAKMIGKKSNFLSVDNEIEEYQNLNIGEIEFQGVIYDFDNELWDIQTQMPKNRKKITKDYMKSNGGVRVYRDNFRIFNYGEYGSDILELDLERVNRPAGRISSNQVLAAIKLKRKDSTDLIEKTNREGFINNRALTAFQNCLKEVTFNLISTLKQDDKAKIITAHLENAKDRVTIEHKIKDIKKLVAQSSIEEDKKEKIGVELDKLSKDFDHTKNVFLSATSTGLNLAIVVHELRHLLNRLSSDLKLGNWNKAIDVTKLLQTTVKNYGDIIRLDKKNNLVSVQSLIKTTLFNVELRFEAHNIKYRLDIPNDLEINVKKNLVSGLLNNLFDNCIYWLNHQNIEDKQIYIKAYKKEGQVHLLIADNGLGFIIDFESAIMPFITGRQDDSSMGIGLYLADQVMTAHQGFLLQAQFEEEKLPDEFSNGALIKLIFKQ